MKLSEWKEALSHSPQDALRFQLLLWKFDRPSYDKWADAVEDCLESIMRQMAAKKNDIQDLSEDALTAQVTTNLTCFGLNATSARVGGNVDVSVSYADGYLWIGEAKIFTGVAHVWDGYLQLTRRYSTGLLTHSRGGLLLYCYKEHADELLAEWRAVLTAQVDSISISDGSRELTFLSADDSIATGQLYSVTHFAFPLHHNPVDGQIKLKSSAMAAGQKVKKEMKKAKKV
jgi:hypothetical protein